MHPDQHGRVPTEITERQREMARAVERVLVHHRGKFPERRREARRTFPMDEPVAREPVPDEIADRDHRQRVPLGEPRQVRQARHRPVVAHDLAEGAAGLEPGQRDEIHRGFRMSGAPQHAARRGPERKHVAGARQVVGPRRGIHERADRRGAIVRRDARRDLVGRADRHGKRGPLVRRVARNHLREIQRGEPRRGEWHGDEPPRVLEHEVDRLRGRPLGGHHQIALVLAILIVDDDDKASVANPSDRLFHRREHVGGLRWLDH